MKIGILKEKDDNRVIMVPELVKKLIDEGNEVIVEKGAGEDALCNDTDYREAGATVKNRQDVLNSANFLATIHPLEKDELRKITKKTMLISSFQPFISIDSLQDIAKAGLTALSLDMIPRITIAQSMDILSSMASIAGYKAVILAANHLPRYFPMLTTAAGSIPPAKVLVLGAGVAGLQAIATAKRLGSVVEAFDTRLAAKEEVESLGAKFVEVEGARDDKSAGGYAVEQTEEYKNRQKALISDHVSKSDAVITTAQLRGKPAPLLITKEMVEKMRPGSVIIDLASSTGGNCELTKDKKTIKSGQITIVGNSDLSADVPLHASQLYGKNIHNFMKLFIKEGKAEFDFDHPVIKSSCVVFEGEILYGREK